VVIKVNEEGIIIREKKQTKIKFVFCTSFVSVVEREREEVSYMIAKHYSN
jgi:hypothetical protein